jgi:hypothetical protein
MPPCPRRRGNSRLTDDEVDVFVGEIWDEFVGVRPPVLE